MSDTVKIKAHIRLENGRLVSKANVKRFVVRGNKDISKSVHGFGFSPSYREQWVVMHEPEGYIWREVTHCLGINGHHPTVRELVRRTAAMGYEIEVLAEPIADAVFSLVKANVERLHAPIPVSASLKIRCGGAA